MSDSFDGGRDSIYLRHILECIAAIESYTEGGKVDFLENGLVSDGVLRRLQVMAESTQRLSSGLKKAAPGIDWRALSGFRNVLVHDYLGGIDLEQVWMAIEHELPALKIEVGRLLRGLFD